MKLGIWLEGNVELCTSTHVVPMPTQIVKIQSPKLDSAISLKVCNLGLLNLVFD